MGAAVGHQADFAGSDAERDEVLTQQAHAQGRGIWGGQLVRTRGRDPVLPHEITHRCPRAHATQQLIVLLVQHEKSPPLASLSCVPCHR